jgi:ubiquinone/menaquinone biosynthesis C-methylase UbiE
MGKLMANYDEIDLEEWENRYKNISRERYLHDHWFHLITNSISIYCNEKNVLDLGCGTGVVSKEIKKYTDDLTAVDNSDAMVKFFKTRINTINVFRADAHNLPFKNHTFDVVVTIGLFEYVDQKRVSEEIARVLKPSGYWIFMSPNKYSPIFIITKLITKILKKRYDRNEPSKKEMINLFRKNKFKIIEFRMDDGLIWLPNFLDKHIGIKIYKNIEKIFKPFEQNPISTHMMFVLKKT